MRVAKAEIVDLPLTIARALAGRSLRTAELARGGGCGEGTHGYDVFGMQPDVVAMSYALLRWPYERYFRVDSRGHEHVPRSGAAILVANHGGVLPLDAAMIYADVLRHTSPPRVVRPIGAVFLPRLPFIGTLFSRLGMVNGSRANVRRLLDDGSLLLVFPEGTTGTAKTIRQRYLLQAWRVGHAELAMRHRAPVIPVGVVGTEEAWPLVARIDRFHAFGAPYLPIAATPLPLPARCHIRYGPPLQLHADGLDPDDPVHVARAAERVHAAVSELVDRGLRERRGVFV
jgi:1-acyl-sn-glycerol-3-phosphate acyltransferase